MPFQTKNFFSAYPERLVDALCSVKTSDILREIVIKRHNLTREQAKETARISGEVMLGRIKFEDFIKTLAEEAKIDYPLAREIAQEINQKIFYPVREEIKQVQRGEYKPKPSLPFKKEIEEEESKEERQEQLLQPSSEQVLKEDVESSRVFKKLLPLKPQPKPLAPEYKPSYKTPREKPAFGQDQYRELITEKDTRMPNIPKKSEPRIEGNIVDLRNHETDTELKFKLKA